MKYRKATHLVLVGLILSGHAYGMDAEDETGDDFVCTFLQHTGEALGAGIVGGAITTLATCNEHCTDHAFFMGEAVGLLVFSVYMFVRTGLSIVQANHAHRD